MIKFETERTATQSSPVTGYLVFAALALSILSLFLERIHRLPPFTACLIQIVDFSVLALFLSEVALELFRAPDRVSFMRRRLADLIFLALFVVLFAYNKTLLFSGRSLSPGKLPITLIVIRNLFVLFKVFGRVRRLTAFLRSVTVQPARTVIMSFALAIVAGSLLLVQPFVTMDGRGLTFVDALFTSTSAVCVTGLIVVDTATAFTLWGKIIILGLIQIGGLGIMVLSYFVVFTIGRSASIEDKLLLSYMLSERDMRHLSRSLKSIIYLTFLIETTGALLLFWAFSRRLPPNPPTVFLSLFHSISAFCNAGFSLFSDSLESYRSDITVNLVICTLIVFGGLSFAVLINLIRYGNSKVKSLLREKPAQPSTLSLNTKIILLGTVTLIVLGMLFLYGSEHRKTLFSMDLKTQYLSAFFQSITLRTAGFNTIDMTSLTAGSYLFMIMLMFIGAASGSTAGGIKINTVAVLTAQVRSTMQDRQTVTLSRYSISRDLVIRAFLILLFGITAVITGALLLTLTEGFPFVNILFETVSAFGTVGLSTGITAKLTVVGRLIVTLLMFAGRLGPLTLLAAATERKRRVHIEYPQGDIILG
jgi:trk system potassium uptake protein TrkH